jgi:hypothetical protein
MPWFVVTHQPDMLLATPLQHEAKNKPNSAAQKQNL